MFDIKAFRKELGLTQREMARRINVDHTTISKAENHGVISDRLIASLVRVYPQLDGIIQPSGGKSNVDNASDVDVYCATVVNHITMIPTGEVLYLPNIPSGCIAVRNGSVHNERVTTGELVVMQAIEFDIVPYGELVMVKTKDLSIIRVIRRSSFEGYIRLESKHGDAIELKLSDVQELYLAVAAIRYF